MQSIYHSFNYTLSDHVFEGIFVLFFLQMIPVEALVQGKSEDAFNLLLWFKDFFNIEGRKCTTLETCDEEGLVSLPAQRPRAITQLHFCKALLLTFLFEPLCKA